MNSTVRSAFFGTPYLAVVVLDELEKAGFSPKVVVTGLDKPKGRGLLLAPPPAKTWAEERGIEVLQPEKLDGDFARRLAEVDCQLFLAVAYGKIIPQKILDIPRHGTLNVHPSLLPKYRGPSPVQAQILADERDVGVTVMRVDAKMDHGPIVAQRRFDPETWPERARTLSRKLFELGGKLLVETAPKWIDGEITAVPQDETEAIYTKLIDKEDGRVDLEGDGYQNFLAFNAYDGWPGTYFFSERNGKKIRVKIASARYENGVFVVERVIPEGGREIAYENFVRGIG